MSSTAPSAAPGTAPRAAPPPLVITFSALRPEDQPIVGGKAHSLGTLAAAGFPVPPGFALTTEALRLFLEAGALAGDLATVEEKATSGGLSLQESWAFLGETRKKIVAAPLPPAVQRAVVDSWRALAPKGEPVAVRSSGVKEDLEGASFAGQYETFLNVRGEEALEDAVKRCWASIWRNRVLQYAAKKGGGAKDLAMSVVVQRMVDADVSGVLFTVNPVTGREREMLVESVFGLGEALVSGKVNADRFVVDAQSGKALSTAIAEKKLKCVALPPGESEKSATGAKIFTREVPLSGAEAKMETLGAPQLAALADLGARVQEHYGRPMDIEWVLEKGALFAVQARPITTLSFAADYGEWTTADFKDGGVASDVCSPLMWSLYESVLEHSMPRYFKDIKLLDKRHEAKWGRMFFARPYWNLGEVKKVLEKIPGYVERNFDLDLGVAVTYEGPGRTTPTTLRGIAGALPVLFALKRNYKERIAADKRFHETFPARVKEYDLTKEALAAIDRDTFAKRLRALITGLYFEAETSYFYTIYNTSNSKLDFKVHFEKAAAACEKKGERLDYLALVSGLEDLSHMRPMKDLHDVCMHIHTQGRAPTDAEVAAFAHRWRHRGRKELDIRVPRWPDDLAYVRDMIEQAAARWTPESDPIAHARAQHATYEKAREQAVRAFGWAHPLQRRGFLDGLALVRTYAWWREEMRDHSSFAYYLVRLWCVEAARRLVLDGTLGSEDDVWYLTFQELIAVFEGKLAPGEAQRRVGVGRRMVRSFRRFQNPNEIGSRFRMDDKAPAVTAGALRGTGCAPGRVEGRAKIVRELGEAKKVEKGDILVTVFTDPGWTPLLGLVAGVVTETGGLLSHAAVISREYGIPAVLAVPGATSRVKDGDLIVVDGGAGTVEIRQAG